MLIRFRSALDVLYGARLERVAEIATEILDEAGAVINPLPLRARSYRLQTGFMQELRADGRDI
jgi:hypothetical protein